MINHIKWKSRDYRVPHFQRAYLKLLSSLATNRNWHRSVMGHNYCSLASHYISQKHKQATKIHLIEKQPAKLQPNSKLLPANIEQILLNSLVVDCRIQTILTLTTYWNWLCLQTETLVLSNKTIKACSKLVSYIGQKTKKKKKKSLLRVVVCQSCLVQLRLVYSFV